MDKILELEARIIKIEERNLVVSLDKKWEGSLVRKLLLIFFTYISILIYFLVIKINHPFLNAVVPAIGFFLSTLTLPLFKKQWLKYSK